MKKAITTSVTCVLVGVTIWLGRAAFRAGPDERVYRGSEEHTRYSQSASTSHRKLMAKALEETSGQQSPEEAPVSATAQEAESRKSQALDSRDSRSRDLYPRLAFDVVPYIMDHPDSVDYRILVRHRELNQADQPISRDAVEQLKYLIDTRRGSFRELMRNFRSLRRSEISALIDSGVMKPATLKSASEASLRLQARLMANKTGESRTPDQILALLKESPQYEGISGSHSIRDGKVYLWSEIERLPHSDKLLADIYMLSYELLGFVLAFFENQNCLAPARVAELLDRASKRVPSDSRVPRRKEKNK